MSEIIWKSIPDAELYEASSDGQIRRNINGPKAVNTYPGKILKHDCTTGYARVSLLLKGKTERGLVHRLVARTFLGPSKPFSHINHKDGNKRNNRVENLEWCSPQHNTRHAWDNGLCVSHKGERHGASKLKEWEVQRIREARGRGVPLESLAQVFNINITAVSYIALNKTWKHLPYAQP